MSRALLTINAGSSSIKFALFALGEAAGPRQFVSGQIERIGLAPHFIARDRAGREIGGRQWPGGAAVTHEELFADLLPWIEAHLGRTRLAAVGHRVVHGGQHFAAPLLLPAPVLRAPALAELDALVPLAPLHQPHNLSAIRAIAALRAGLPQVACFDTAFHRAHADQVRRFALPRALSEAGIERYGFHGLSYEFIAGRLRQSHGALAGGRVVVAHLGNGASLCALDGGRSVDTTMGFTALEGLPMGTRCGAIDPGVILYLLQGRAMSIAAVEDLLYHRSGLLGVSGVSADMRELLASADPHAAEAVDLFCFRIARETAALANTLGGLDGIVFTAGIGEHAAPVRARVCAHLAWLGVALDPAANAADATTISTAESRVAALVIPTDEEAMIAAHTAATVPGLGPP
ncbi:MAG: acetate/propionate family kinase [Rhodospirillales bacterium]|nr:acetate/propionate family kinase [Rhodospirillales bacterium]MDE2573734.1 acetate/propionate family kinase [Rhodospirillales bacterium]